jgi:transcription antitermination factor NusG
MSDIANAAILGDEDRSAVAAEQGLAWYAIRVRPRAEKLVAAALRGKEYEEFLPLYRKRNRWSDRVKVIEYPLFPGYVFCRADLSGHPPLVTTPSVIGILSFGGSPALISEQEIEAIKTVLRSGFNSEPWPYLRDGDRVRIISGSLAGIEGLLVRSKSDCRIVLSVDVLCRSIAVEVDRQWVVPVTSSKPFLYAF